MNNWLEQAREKIGMIPKVERDDHHLLHTGVYWNATANGRSVRNRMVARGMSRTIHDLLHHVEAPVPVPSPHSLQIVYNNLPERLDIFEAVDRYCQILDRTNRHPRIKPIEIDLNNLSIQAVQNQLPYLHDGLSTRRFV